MKLAFAVLLVLTAGAQAQDIPSPYNPGEHQWATPPAGKPWGSSAGIERGPHGDIWAIDRCGAECCGCAGRRGKVRAGKIGATEHRRHCRQVGHALGLGRPRQPCGERAGNNQRDHPREQQPARRDSSFLHGSWLLNASE